MSSSKQSKVLQKNNWKEKRENSTGINKDDFICDSTSLRNILKVLEQSFQKIHIQLHQI